MEPMNREENLSTIADALRQLLRSNFLSMKDYRKLVSSGKLVAKKTWEDDYDFQQLYPDHPLSSVNRFNRIHLADLIRDNAKTVQDVLPEEILGMLHDTLFDCCAAVRHSLAYALFCGGSRRSAYYLGKLLEEESESKMVRECALIGRERCLKREGTRYHNAQMVQLVSNDIDLAAAILAITELEGAKLVMPDHNYSELIAWSSTIKIVDRWLMGKESWDTYCSYLDDMNETKTNYPLKDEDGSILMEEPIFDYTPLVIIDSCLKESMRVFKEPNKPKDKVFYVEGGRVDVVAKITQFALQGRPLDLHELNREINQARACFEG